MADKTGKKPLASFIETEVPTKRLAINKAQAQMVAVVAGAAFVTVFCLIAAKSVLGQNEYLSRVISKENKAHQQLISNLQAFNSPNGLAAQYQSFDSEPVNRIGGNLNGTGANDGSNSKIILDALPPIYDFPALTSSIEKILDSQGLKITSISGTDEQLTQQTNISSPTPSPVSMPFSFSINGANYGAVQKLIQTLQQSIRPIAIDTMTLSGASNSMTLNVTAHSYYQPAKSVNISQQEVK